MPWHSGRELRGAEKALVCLLTPFLTPNTLPRPKAGSGLKYFALQLKAP